MAPSGVLPRPDRLSAHVGARNTSGARAHPDQRRAAHGDDHRREHRRSTRAGRLPPPFRRSQPRAAIRPCRLFGQRLDIPAGTAVRFEPGDTASAGALAAHGAAGSGRADEGSTLGLAGARWRWHASAGSRCAWWRRRLMAEISRQHYAELYGPTTGDRFRLADTDSSARSSATCGAHGDEAVFGGGKTDPRRHGAGLAHQRRAARSTWSSPTSSSWTRCSASSRPTSASRTGGSSASARPATRTSWTASRPAW